MRTIQKDMRIKSSKSYSNKIWRRGQVFRLVVFVQVFVSFEFSSHPRSEIRARKLREINFISIFSTRARKMQRQRQCMKQAQAMQQNMLSHTGSMALVRNM